MSLSRDTVETINKLVKAGHIDAARTLLKSLDGPQAQAALTKLNERYPLAKSDSAPSSRVVMGVVAVLCLVVIGAAGLLLIQRTQPPQRADQIRASLQNFCITGASLVYDLSHVSDQTITDTCWQEAVDTYNAAPEKVTFCFDSLENKDSVAEWLDCLTTYNIRFGNDRLLELERQQ